MVPWERCHVQHLSSMYVNIIYIYILGPISWLGFHPFFLRLKNPFFFRAKKRGHLGMSIFADLWFSRIMTYSNVWSSWDDINGPVNDSTFLHDDFMILFEFCWNLAKCPNYEINSTKFSLFFFCYRRWYLPDLFLEKYPAGKSWLLTNQLKSHQPSAKQSDDTYRKLYRLILGHFHGIWWVKKGTWVVSP